MSGKIAIMSILITSLVAAFGLYYLQVHHFYEELDPDSQTIELVSVLSLIHI